MVLYKPRRNSLRLPNYDYSQEGCYFITTDVRERKFVFNNSKYQRIAERQLQGLEERFKVSLDNYVVMANHIHLLLTILERMVVLLNGGDKPRPYALNGGDKPRPYALNGGDTITRSITVGEIIGSLKSLIWYDLRRIGYQGKLWQRGFYEHVIRNDKDYQEKWWYIEKNKFQAGQELNI